MSGRLTISMFAVAGLLLARYDARNPNPVQGKPLEKVLSGVKISWNDRLLRRIFVTMLQTVRRSSIVM